MPLNIQDPEEQKPSTPQKPGIPAGAPGTAVPGGSRKLLLWIFAVAVLASAFFLLIQFGIISPRGGGESGRAPAPESTELQPATTPLPPEKEGASGADSAARAGAPDRKSDSERAAELRQRLAAAEGEYTIFISAFSAATDAEELAGRWERAGYRTTVQHAGRWYRVGIGNFATVPAAREEAEKIRQALEEGYWIGRATSEEKL